MLLSVIHQKLSSTCSVKFIVTVRYQTANEIRSMLLECHAHVDRVDSLLLPQNAGLQVISAVFYPIISISMRTLIFEVCVKMCKLYIKIKIEI